MQQIVVASTTRTRRSVNYMHWHQTAARTSQTQIILQPTYNQGSYYFAEFIFPDFSRQNE